MSDFVNDFCSLCRDCRKRNDSYNTDIMTSATVTDLVIDGTLHQHRTRGATAFTIVASTRQVYIPHISEADYHELDTSQDFVHHVQPLSHLLLHMVTGSVVAIPSDAGVMLVRLVSGPITGPMTGRRVYSFSGSTAPYCGGAEGADTLLHVDGALERPGCTQPFHTVYRDIEVIGYLRPGSSAYSKSIASRQVTTTVKMLVSLADIRPTLAEAMSETATATATAPVGPGTVSSNSAASSHPTLDDATAHLVCDCYPANKSLVATLLATAYRLHGSDLMSTPSECTCAICTHQIGQCVECFGALMREEEEECV